MNRNRDGFSLVELMVCLSIIMILMAMYLPVLSKAKRKAEEVAIREGFRQEKIGRLSDTANAARRHRPAHPTREECRLAYRKTMSDGSGEGDIIVTEMLYAVTQEDQFRAYWHTLINPAATDPLEYTDSHELIAKDEDGNEFYLTVADGDGLLWEYFSTHLADTSSGTIGMNVLYPDGQVGYVRYPSTFPAVRSVAELSHRFVVETT